MNLLPDRSQTQCSDFLCLVTASFDEDPTQNILLRQSQISTFPYPLARLAPSPVSRSSCLPSFRSSISTCSGPFCYSFPRTLSIQTIQSKTSHHKDCSSSSLFSSQHSLQPPTSSSFFILFQSSYRIPLATTSERSSWIITRCFF